MAVGGPPWSNGSAVRAGFATVAAVVAVLLAWLVARLGLPLLHAVVWPLYGLSFVAVGRMVWRETQVEEPSTVAVAVETMMIVVGVACALMGSTAALGSPRPDTARDRPDVLGTELGRGPATVSADVAQASLAAGAGLAAALSQFGAAGLVPSTSTSAGPTTSAAGTSSTAADGTSTSTSVAATTSAPDVPASDPTTTAASGSVRVTTTTRPPVIGTPTTIRRATTTVPVRTVPTTPSPTSATTPPTAPPTTPPTVPPTTPPTTADPTTTAPTTPPTTADPPTTTVPG